MKNLLLISDKLPNLSKEVFDNYKKPILIASSVFGSVLIGGLIVRKIYVKKINDLVDETRKREDEKKIKLQAADLNRSLNQLNFKEQQSNSLPTTPSTVEPNSTGLSFLVQTKPQSNSLPLDRVSLNSHFVGRINRKRNLNSLCSYQLNLQIDNPIELIIFGNEYVKRALKILEDVKSRNKGMVVFNLIKF